MADLDNLRERKFSQMITNDRLLLSAMIARIYWDKHRDVLSKIIDEE